MRKRLDENPKCLQEKCIGAPFCNFNFVHVLGKAENPTSGKKKGMVEC
jgi:hypothetical protein